MNELKEKQEAFLEDDEHCPETDNESESLSVPKKGARTICTEVKKSKISAYMETDMDDDDNAPLTSFLPRKGLQNKGASKKDLKPMLQENTSILSVEYVHLGKEARNLEVRRSRKRPRIVILDEDNEESFASADNGSEIHVLTNVNERLLDQNEAILQSREPQTIGKKGEYDNLIESFGAEVKERNTLREKVSSPNKKFTEQLETSELGSVKYDSTFSISNANAGVEKVMNEDEMQTSGIQRKDFIGKCTSPMMDEANSVLNQVIVLSR